MLLQALHSWQPFKIDALGLVTLLGASDMDQNLGRLSRYSYLEYMPLLGAFIIANNDIAKPIPGFTLYNVTDGIMATDIAAWFGRWISSHDFSWNSSCLHISPNPTHHSHKKSLQTDNAVSAALSFAVMAAVVSITILTEDWWGLVNAISMVISIISRAVIMSENRQSLDIAYKMVSEESWATEYKTILLMSANGKAISIYAPCGVITEILLSNPSPLRPWFYFLARAIGWGGFALHVVSLGMALLINQLITVVVLILSTVLVANRFGAQMLSVGSEIQVERFDEVGGRDSRSRAYLRMDLSKTEEATMLAWGLFPQRSNTDWWAKYREGGAETGRGAFDGWKSRFWRLPRRNGVDNTPKHGSETRAYSV